MRQPRHLIYIRYVKPLFDIILAILLLPLIAPLLAILIIAIKLDSPGPAIYHSQRVGKNGKLFNCLKLRSMVMNAEEKLKYLLQSNRQLAEEYRQFCKLKNDPRVTKTGRFLRKFSLDELPQIFNIFKGQMSWIGPRPAFSHELEEYYLDSSQYYKSVRPGISGLWQISGRNELSFHERVLLDKRYALECSLAMDTKIFFKTFTVVFLRKGAY